MNKMQKTDNKNKAETRYNNNYLQHQTRKSFELIMNDLKKLRKSSGRQTTLESLNEYGSSFDFIEAGTFKGQKKDYYEYQLDYEEPPEEFRIFKNGKVEFWSFWSVPRWKKIVLSSKDALFFVSLFEDFMTWKKRK